METPRLNLRPNSKHRGGKIGRGSVHHGATTRHLTRITTFLTENPKQYITTIAKNCFGSCSCRSIRDAIQWLLSNKVIILTTKRGHKEYSVNPEWLKFRYGEEGPQWLLN